MSGLVACSVISGGEAYSAKKVPVKTFKAGEVIPGRHIVLSRSDVDPVELARSYGIKSGISFKYGVKGFAAFIEDLKISKLKSDPRVVLVEPS